MSFHMSKTCLWCTFSVVCSPHNLDHKHMSPKIDRRLDRKNKDGVDIRMCVYTVCIYIYVYICIYIYIYVCVCV